MVQLFIRRSSTYMYGRKLALFILTLLVYYLVYMLLQGRSIHFRTVSFYSKCFMSKSLDIGNKTKDISNKNKVANVDLSYAASNDLNLDLLNDWEQAGISHSSSDLKYGTFKLPYTGEKNRTDRNVLAPEDSSLEFGNETVTARNKVNNEGSVARRLPNCIIFGTRKSGTAALMKILDIHPKVHLLNTEMPLALLESNYSRVEEFRNTMPLSYDDDIIIHKCADYFSSKMARYKIYKYRPDMKLIVTVKHPVTRAVADYRQFKDAHPWVNKSFQEFVTKQSTGELNLTSMPLNASIYVEHLQKWYFYFPREQVHVVDGEKLITDPLEEIRLVENFLGLKHEITNDHVQFDEKKGFYCMRKNIEEEFHCLSKRKGGLPKPYVDPKFEQKLREFYHPYNEQFFKLINRTFNWE